MDLVYAAAYLDRDVESTSDYTGYSEYYESWGGCYAKEGGYYTDSLECNDPTQIFVGDEKFSRQSHELRLQSSQENRLRWIAGIFYQRQKHDFDYQWIVPGMDSVDSVIEGGHTTWQTKQIRIDRDKAVFGELSYDITDDLNVTAGVRAYEFENSLYGFNGMYLWHCGAAGGRVCYENPNLDDVKKGSGESYKLNVNYTINDDAMVYGTYSEGFRAGGVNRAKLVYVPSYEPDYVTNYEFGWKISSEDKRLRFNGAVYFLDWKNVQMATLDFSISQLTIIHNAGAARTKGAEFDLSYAASENLTLSFAASYNDAKLQKDFGRRDAEGVFSVTAAAGTPMPFVPKTQFTAIARYTDDIADFPAFAQIALSYTGKSWSSIEAASRHEQKDYTLVNLSAGIDGDDWSVGLFADNLFDTRAQISYNDPGYYSVNDTSFSTNRPRSLGIRFGQKFQ